MVLILRAILVVTVLTDDAIGFGTWAARGFGHFCAVRPVFFCSLSLFLGVEILFSSAFLSMMGISRDTYIGE